MTSLKRLARFAGRVLHAFARNRGILLAGGVGYNALLSLVPFLVITVSALSVFFDEEQVVAILRPELTALVPQHADTLVQTAEAFLQSQPSTRALSVAFMLFFSSIAFRMLEEAVAAIFHTSGHAGRRSFWVSALLPYVFMLLLMVALFFLTLLTAGLDALDARPARIFVVETSLEYVMRILLRLSGFLGLVVLFAGMYLVLPVVRIPVRRALVGGVAAAVLWRVTSVFTVYYFTNVSMVGVLYGSLANVIVVLLSLEIVFVILLLGAQIIAELQASSVAGLRWWEDPRDVVGWRG